VKHEVPRDEIYKHLCIANALHATHHNEYGYVGIYKIGSEWWCGQYAPGGHCNIKCSDLVDDDIADDIACANKILASSGLEAWRTTDSRCRRYTQTVDDCLGDEEILDSLMVLASNTTEITSTSTTTTSKTTSTTQPLRTWAQTTTRRTTSTVAPRSSSSAYMDTSLETDKTNARAANKNHVEDESSTVLITVLGVLIFIALMVIGAFHYRKTKRIRLNSHVEFENALIENPSENF
jgi:hypothetical protein